MRAVFDTNVLISAFVFPGDAPEQVYRRELDGRITLITSRPLLRELGRVLTEKFDWAPPYAEEVVAQVVHLAVLVDPTEVIADITDDPADNRVLEAAAASDADVIVGGDRHLLTLGTWQSIRVVTPAVAIDELE